MGAQSTVMLPETLRSIAASTFTGSYQAVGTALANSARLIKFVNNTNQLVTVSWDGTHDHDILPSDSFALYDLTSNRGNPSPYLAAAQGTQFYVKASSGTGSFYVVALYAYNSSVTLPGQ